MLSKTLNRGKENTRGSGKEKLQEAPSTSGARGAKRRAWNSRSLLLQFSGSEEGLCGVKPRSLQMASSDFSEGETHEAGSTRVGKTAQCMQLLPRDGPGAAVEKKC